MDSETLRIFMGICGVIIMAAFMPWTAYSFFTFRLKRKKTEYSEMLKQLGYSKGKGPAYLPSLEDEYEPLDYYLPVTFATTITILCAIVLVFGSTIANHPDISLIINGPSIAYFKDLGTNDKNTLFGMLIIALAFMGSYIWSIQALYRRLATVDLTPGVYYSLGIRIIFSIFIAMLIYYWLTNGNIETILKSDNPLNTPSNLALYSFFAGMFPQRALQYLQDKVIFINSSDKMKADPLPLQMIEGIGLYERTRFIEVGIENVQNLAKSNFIDLIIRTPFNPREIIDWIGQARLHLYFKNDIVHLRNAGIRTIFNLKTLGKNEKFLEKTASLTKQVPIDKLKIVYEIIKDDKDIEELNNALDKLILTQKKVKHKHQNKSTQ
jgi:hypothetical protein